MTSDSSNDEELIIVQNCRMSCTSLRNRPRYGWLCPICGLEVEDYEVGEVGSMFVFAAEDE